MKKIKVLFGIWLILIMGAVIIQSCEKDEPQVLSEFIVGGEWTYEQIEVLQTLTFTGQFLNNGTYVLSLTDGNVTLSFDGDYNIDDDTNVLTLDEPDIDQSGGEPEQVVFDVVWTEGIDKMVWTEVGDATNVLTWFKNN